MASRNTKLLVGGGLAVAVAFIAWLGRRNEEDAGNGCVCVTPNRTAQRAAAQRLVNPLPFGRLAEGIACANDLGKFMALRFAMQQFRYVPDPEACDRWCPPEVTVSRGTGDCDDWAIVVASILRAVGIGDVRVALGTVRGGGHAWVEGADHHGWFLLEATNGAVYRNRPPAYAVDELVVV